MDSVNQSPNSKIEALYSKVDPEKKTSKSPVPEKTVAPATAALQKVQPAASGPIKASQTHPVAFKVSTAAISVLPQRPPLHPPQSVDSAMGEEESQQRDLHAPVAPGCYAAKDCQKFDLKMFKEIVSKTNERIIGEKLLLPLPTADQKAPLPWTRLQAVEFLSHKDIPVGFALHINSTTENRECIFVKEKEFQINEQEFKKNELLGGSKGPGWRRFNLESDKAEGILWDRFLANGEAKLSEPLVYPKDSISSVLVLLLNGSKDTNGRFKPPKLEDVKLEMSLKQISDEKKQRAGTPQGTPEAMMQSYETTPTPTPSARQRPYRELPADEDSQENIGSDPNYNHLPTGRPLERVFDNDPYSHLNINPAKRPPEPLPTHSYKQSGVQARGYEQVNQTGPNDPNRERRPLPGLPPSTGVKLQSQPAAYEEVDLPSSTNSTTSKLSNAVTSDEKKALLEAKLNQQIRALGQEMNPETRKTLEKQIKEIRQILAGPEKKKTENK